MLVATLGILGTGLLVVGGELVVRGSVTLARRLELPPMLIGLVVVGFSTSAPELLVSLRATLAGNPGIAVGSAVGSDIANFLLVLGMAALIFPAGARGTSARRDAIVLTLSLAGLVALAATGTLQPWHGALMFVALLAYVGLSYRADSKSKTATARLHAEEAIAAEGLAEPLWLVLAILAAGVLCLAVGASWMVSAAVGVATALGVSQATTGLTIVSLGTSLPELGAALSAARHRQTDIVMGNIIGSNIFNVLGILGIAAMVRPLPIDRAIVLFDLPFAVLISLALLPVFLGRRRLGRTAAIIMIAGYVAYVSLRFIL